MKDEKLRNILNKYGEENEVTFKLFDNPNFDKSIVGISSDQRVVYDYDLMIQEFAEDNNCTAEEAEEFIQYNTMRALPYFDDVDGNKPIIIENKLGNLEAFYGD